MKFELYLPMVSEKTMFRYIYGTSLYTTLAERLTVSLDFSNLFIVIVSLVEHI